MFYLRSIHGFYAAALLELGGLLAGGGEGGAGGRGGEAGSGRLDPGLLFRGHASPTTL